MSVKKVLCTYATRQIDSNLLMAGTIFNGLQLGGYDVDIVFCGPDEVYNTFFMRYAKFFKNVWHIPLHDSSNINFCSRISRLNLLYSYLRHFVLDGIRRPYLRKTLRQVVSSGAGYDCVLSFVPPFFSGLLGIDVCNIFCDRFKVELVQFWTDPLSLGGVSRISEIPRRRKLHILAEHRLLKAADRAVFNFPLLCELEKELHPEFADKMSWTDVGYIEHELDDLVPRNAHPTVGLFGAYQRKVRNIAPFLEAVRQLPMLRFVLRGDTDISIDSSLYPNLDVKFGRQPVSEVEKLEANCDVLVSLNSHSGMMPPGKTFYYASYAKPIVYIADGERQDYLMKYMTSLGRYVVCRNTADSIVDGIERAVSSLPGFHRNIPERMRLDVIAKRIIG